MNELPIDRPGKVIAVGLNYRDHAAESDAPLPESPILFAKWSTCLIPDGASVVFPPAVDEADYDAAPRQAPTRLPKGLPSLMPGGASFLLPPGVDEADYEAELAVVIGRTAR